MTTYSVAGVPVSKAESGEAETGTAESGQFEFGHRGYHPPRRHRVA